MNKHIMAILVLVLVLCSCKTTGVPGHIDVYGMIYDFLNKPVPFCDVSLNAKLTGSTDINGRFGIPKVPRGAYTLTCLREGYETYQDSVFIGDRGQIIYVRIPSQSQLLTLTDDALTAMNLETAEEYIERAYLIDKNNIEMLFYYAAIKFRQRKYGEAAGFLITARELGSRDIYIERFLNILKGLQNDQTE